jgi:hypothetical protein
LRTEERAAHAAREERHVQAQQAVDALERLEGEIAEAAELEPTEPSGLAGRPGDGARPAGSAIGSIGMPGLAERVGGGARSGGAAPAASETASTGEPAEAERVGAGDLPAGGTSAGTGRVGADEGSAVSEAEAAGVPAWVEQLRLGPDEPPEPTFDLEAARRRVATLQRELRAVGGVADSVVAEYRELSARHDFLQRQSEDLRSAMHDLERTAAELEEHMRARFSAVLQAVDAAFQDCFRHLFGGGEARLVLTEPDDLLRSGIDIVARPPGKKLQGLLSLSGGERALTIVAMLFGLLRVNPTPFCVLDEVDAALDEANVERFANLLAEFARRIQFVVVTHNRATMDKADALYGVSMQAEGVSKVVSQRLRDEPRPLRRQARPRVAEIDLDGGQAADAAEPGRNGGNPNERTAADRTSALEV